MILAKDSCRFLWKKVLKYWVITLSCRREHAQGWVCFHRDLQTFQWTSQCHEALNEPTMRFALITLWIINKGSQTSRGIINTCYPPTPGFLKSDLGGWSMRIYSCNKYPGDPDAVGPETTLKKYQIKMYNNIPKSHLCIILPKFQGAVSTHRSFLKSALIKQSFSSMPLLVPLLSQCPPK